MPESKNTEPAPIRDAQGLENEINLIRRLIQLLDEDTTHNNDAKGVLRMLDIVSGASLRLSRLLRAQHDIESSPANSLSEKMDRILIQLAREKGIID